MPDCARILCFRMFDPPLTFACGAFVAQLPKKRHNVAISLRRTWHQKHAMPRHLPLCSNTPQASSTRTASSCLQLFPVVAFCAFLWPFVASRGLLWPFEAFCGIESCVESVPCCPNLSAAVPNCPILSDPVRFCPDNTCFSSEA